MDKELMRTVLLVLVFLRAVAAGQILAPIFQKVPTVGCSTQADAIAVNSNVTANLGQFSGDAYFAMSFSAGSTYTLCSLSVQMAKVGSPTFNITASIYTDSAGQPGSIVGTGSGSVAASSLPASVGTVLFTGLSSSLTSGTTYWVVLHASATTDPNYAPWSYNGNSGGLSVYHSADGTTWTVSNSFVAGLSGFTTYK